GSPIMSPSQDIVMGIFYLTLDFSPLPPSPDAKPRRFASEEEALLAYAQGRISIHEKIRVRIRRDRIITSQKKGPEPVPANKIVETTAGRRSVHDARPPEPPLPNSPPGQKGAGRVIAHCPHLVGRSAPIDLLERFTEIGLRWSTLAGVS